MSVQLSHAEDADVSQQRYNSRSTAKIHPKVMPDPTSLVSAPYPFVTFHSPKSSRHNSVNKKDIVLSFVPATESTTRSKLIPHTTHSLFSLIVRTLTCSKLTHCLFDFDCKDLNVYEDEQYNFQEFNYRDCVHNKFQATSTTTNDRKSTQFSFDI